MFLSLPLNQIGEPSKTNNYIRAMEFLEAPLPFLKKNPYASAFFGKQYLAATWKTSYKILIEREREFVNLVYSLRCYGQNILSVISKDFYFDKGTRQSGRSLMYIRNSNGSRTRP